jgi:hypothetical protein
MAENYKRYKSKASGRTHLRVREPAFLITEVVSRWTKYKGRFIAFDYEMEIIKTEYGFLLKRKGIDVWYFRNLISAKVAADVIVNDIIISK